jgi:carboxymethylenebutenolidase
MCHSTDARPPLPPIRGGAIDARDLDLTSSDGTRFAAHAAVAATPGGAGIVILPDVRGLHPFYEDLANRLAEAGVHALALDLYARTAGAGHRGPEFEYMPHVDRAEHATISADVRAGVEAMRTPELGAAERVYTMGFCFGGRASFIQSAEGHGLAGVIGFYGSVAGPGRAGLPAPTDVAKSFECPVLGLFGGADAGIPADSVAAFGAALDEAGIAHELITYPGAPHSFFDRSAADHADAAQDAWRRVLAFVGVPVPGS